MIYVDKPEVGHYWRRFVKGGRRVACRIWEGPPLDPLTGEELDRSPRLQAVVDGNQADPYETWVSCAGNRISEQEYIKLLEGERQEVTDWKRNATIF